MFLTVYLRRILNTKGQLWLMAHVFSPCLPHLISCPPTGLEDYMKRYGQGIQRVLTSFGPVPDFFGEGAKGIVNVSMMAKEPVRLLKFHRRQLVVLSRH